MKPPAAIAFGIVGALTLAAAAARVVQAADRYPTTYMEVTTRQQDENGELSRSIHVFRLFCNGEMCSMRILTLNQCMTAGFGGKFFYPDIAEYRTDERTLSATFGRHSVIARWVARTPFGDAETTVRFDFKTKKGDTQIGSPTGFQGDYVKESTATKKTHRIKYVPIKEFEKVPMDCPAGALNTIRPD